MTALIWKDFRLNKPLLLVCGSIVVLIYVIGVVAEVASSWPTLPSAESWAGMLVSYGTVLLYLSFCITGLLGGYAIAVERSERSAHFLAALPPTKMQILGSKLFIAACATGVIWAWILFTLEVLAPRLNSQPMNLAGATISGAAAVCLLTFGVGWFASACMERPTVPIILALCSPVAVSIALTLAAAVLGVPKVQISKWSNVVCVTTGIVTIIAGSWSYGRRVKP